MFFLTPTLSVVFFLLKHASQYTFTNSSVNFTWFVLLSHQRFDERPLFKPGSLWFAIFKYFCKTKIIFAINRFQTMQNLYLWKNMFLKIYSECLIYSMNLIYIYIHIKRNAYISHENVNLLSSSKLCLVWHTCIRVAL